MSETDKLLANYATREEVMTDLVYSAIPRAVLMFGRGMGLDYDDLQRKSGLHKEVLAHADNPVPYSSVIRLWKYLLECFPGEALGVRFSQVFDVRQMGIVGSVIAHSPNVGVAMNRMIRLQHLVDPHLAISLNVEHDFVACTIEHEPDVVNLVEPMEGMVGHIITFVDTFTKGLFKPVSITLAHGQTHSDEIYLQSWKCIPSFGQEVYSVTFPGHLLRQEIAGADPQTGQYLFEYAKQLGELHDGSKAPSFAQQVEKFIIHALDIGDMATQAETAKAMNLSARTFQRRLGEEKTSYNAVLEKVRKAKAFVLLETSEISMFEIAFLLGYQEQTSFNRAFKKWTKMSPEAYRRGLALKQ